MDKFDGQSMGIERSERERLQSLFPQCFSEGKLDIDKLLNLCGEYIDNDFEKYKFEWKGKAESFKIAGKRSTGTLRPAPEESVDWDTTQNLYIEGDNLEVLKLLQTAYFNKVKMIYIDPPYNTGHDFVYKDSFQSPLDKYKEITSQTTKSNPESMGRFHTEWLNMIYPRLRLASNLLADDGVIFISIDDNEVINLRKICDEVFGEENFQVIFPRVTKKGGKSSDATAKNHDYVLMYSKNIDLIDIIGVAHNDEGYSNKDEHYEERGYFKLNQTLDYDSLGWVQTLDYPIEISGEIFYAGGSKDAHEARLAGKHGRADWGWRWSKDLFDFGLKNGFIEVKRGGQRPRIYTKTYQNAAIEKVNDQYEVVQIDRTKPLSTLEFTDNTYSNDNAKKRLDELMEKGVFEYTKPPELIVKLMSLIGGKDFTVMDIFSGSGTTAHAVIQLNAEDGGNRKFIMVQLPEVTDEKSEAHRAGYKNICEIGKERIRRAGKQIQDKIKGTYPTLLDAAPTPQDTGFRVFKLDTSNLAVWDTTPIADAQLQELWERFHTLTKTIKGGRSDLDIVYEVMLKMGVPLNYPVTETTAGSKKVYSIGDDILLVCLEKGITPDDIEAMCELAPAKIIAAEEAFADDTALANAHYILRDRGIEMKLL